MHRQTDIQTYRDASHLPETSSSSVTRTRAYRPKAEIVEEVEHMLSCSESPTAIAERLGLLAGSVARALYRAERPDLAVRFEAARRATRGKPCVECGQWVRTHQASRCKPCGYKERERTKRRKVAA
jgi:hypothetical protein